MYIKTFKMKANCIRKNSFKKAYGYLKSSKIFLFEKMF